MLANYLKIAFRSIWKNKIYSFINIIGLAVGIAASVLILLFVSHEYSYDRFHKNANNIFQAFGKIKWGDRVIQVQGMSAQLGPKLKETNGNVVNYVRIKNAGKRIIESDAEHRFFEESFLFVDPTFFNVFSFNVLKGNPASLQKANTIMLTEEIARKYFQDHDPVGKIITYDKNHSFEVVGIVKKAPSSSSIQFGFIASFASLETIPGEVELLNDSKVSMGSYITYIQTKSDVTPKQLALSTKAIASSPTDETFAFEPLVDIHLGNNFGDTANTQNITIFLAVAALILFLALANYVNLTTALGSIRAKEVGIRKTIGARRTALSLQFYVESTVATGIAFLLALVLIETFAPSFLNLLQQDIDSSFVRSPIFITLISTLLVGCIILSGSYPALILSRFKPVEVLKGKLSSAGNGVWLRRGFIIFQFTASIVMIIGSLVVNDQLKLMQNSKTGLNKEQVMVISIDSDLKTKCASLKDAIEKQSSVLSTSIASSALFYHRGTNAFFTKTPKTNEDVFISCMGVDNDFFDLMDIKWVKKETDTIRAGSCVINEAALDKLKITPNDLGTKISLANSPMSIDGIVKDFHYTSLHTKIDGMVISIENDTDSSLVNHGGFIYIKLAPGISMRNSITSIKKTYEAFGSKAPFQYYFLDEAFNNMYKGEERLLTIFSVFTGIAIVIACLGLLGLITFNAERKTKEIGIRKVLGASLQNIVTLLSREFVVIIIVSLLIASPIAWYAMQQWLQKFPYHIEIPISFIAIAGITSLTIALFTISMKAIRAALGNPVNALKND